MGMPRCLMIGSGRDDTRPGTEFEFVTLDIEASRKPDVVSDACRLPFASESFEAVYASHLLEHISPRQAGNVLEEWGRVLKPGGEMLILVPNMGYVAELILSGKGEETVYRAGAGIDITPMDMVYGLPSLPMYRRWGFTRESLAARAKAIEWKEALVYELRITGPYDRCELRLYGRKKGEASWKGWDLDTSKSSDPYAIRIKGE